MTSIDICNRALAILGHDRAITSLDTSVDTSTEATRCALFYPAARDAVLSAQAWEFASVDVAVYSNIPYTLPTSAVRVVSVRDASGNAVPATRSGNTLRFSKDGTLRYISNSGDVSTYPRLVQEAIIAELAFQLYSPILGNPTSRELVETQKAYSSLAEAKLQTAWAAELAEHRWTGAPQDPDAAAKLDIANRALALAGIAANVTDLALDPSEVAVKCRQLLPMAIRATLALHPWEAATATIAASNGTSVPAALVRLVDAKNSSGEPVACRIENGIFKMDEAATVRYISTAADISLLPSGVQDAIALRLAAFLAPSLTEKEAALAAAKELGEQADDAARRAIAQEAESRLYRAQAVSSEELTKLDIANQALALAGTGDTIRSFTEDATPSAVRARQFFDIALRSLLSAHAWSFATRRHTAAYFPPDPAGFLSIPRPADCLRLLDANQGPGKPCDKKAEGDFILVKPVTTAPVTLVYISSLSDLSNAPVFFRDALTAKLAELLSASLDTKDKNNLATLAKEKISLAVAAESHESEHPGAWKNPFIAARFDATGQIPPDWKRPSCSD